MAKKSSSSSQKKVAKKTATKTAKQPVAKTTSKKKSATRKAAKTTKKATKKSTSKARKAAPKAKNMTENASTSTKKKATKKTTKKTAKKSPAVAQKKAAKAAEAAMRDIIARARDHFRRAPEEHTFVMQSGHQLRDLRELAEALDEMHEHVFGHHVNDERHDFANWVHEVLQERALAEQLRQAEKHPKAHQHIIYRHIVRRVW